MLVNNSNSSNLLGFLNGCRSLLCLIMRENRAEIVEKLTNPSKIGIANSNLGSRGAGVKSESEVEIISIANRIVSGTDANDRDL
jgi:hypothetical protein